MSVIKRVKFLPIRVRTQVDGRGYADTDRCSLPYVSEWFASIMLLSEWFASNELP